ncbi:MAG: hypothetical protein SGCHY_004023 [Lobulomycetales sp.]
MQSNLDIRSRTSLPFLSNTNGRLADFLALALHTYIGTFPDSHTDRGSLTSPEKRHEEPRTLDPVMTETGEEPTSNIRDAVVPQRTPPRPHANQLLERNGVHSIMSHTVAEIRHLLQANSEDGLGMTEEIIIFALCYIKRISKRKLSCGCEVSVFALALYTSRQVLAESRLTPLEQANWQLMIDVDRLVTFERDFLCALDFDVQVDWKEYRSMVAELSHLSRKSHAFMILAQQQHD